MSRLVEPRTCKNTDVEIWREILDDYYSPSIHVTKKGGIGINIGGRAIVMDVRTWHDLACKTLPKEDRRCSERGEVKPMGIFNHICRLFRQGK